MAETAGQDLSRFRAKIAFIIPTVNRPRELRRLLASIESQSVPPDEVIIIDGSPEPIGAVLNAFPALNVKYERSLPACLSRQKNAGRAKLGENITIGGYLDDDLVLEPGSVEAMLRFWDDAPDHIGGASFNIINSRTPRGLVIKSFFRMDSRKRGTVMRSGYEATTGPAEKNIDVEWLCGGATVWRRQVLQEYKYDEWFQGYSYFEDVDFSYRVSRKYKLMIVADAKVQHLSPPVKEDRNYALGKCQVINRKYFLLKHANMSPALFCWATLGLIIANIGEAILLRNSGLFERAWGNVVGLFQSTLGRLEQIDTALKD
jgi:GT2 family glycosyltransferase